MPKPELKKYLVLWYCDNEPQCDFDLVKARDEDQAGKIVYAMRPCIQHAEAIPFDGQMDEFRNFDRDDGSEWKELMPRGRVVT